MRCEHCDCGPYRHPPSSPCCYCGDDWNWPHLLARVLYVPGVCAAIGQREWCNAGDRELTKALDDGALPSYWPTWAAKP